MFTGLIEAVGTVEAIERRGGLVRLRVRAAEVCEGTRLGDSIAHNGACLTVVELAPPRFSCEVMVETLRRTTLGELVPGAPVNLERAIAAGGRFGGHFVQGHVDGVGMVSAIGREPDSVSYTISVPAPLGRQIVAQGSIAIDGISLTVVEAAADSFRVALIPHTLTVTTVGGWRVGQRVNLETDLLAKYVAAALGTSERPACQGVKMSWDWLREQGYSDH